MRRPILNAIPFLLLLAGCGGGNGSGTNSIPAGQGRVVFSIKWPARNPPTRVVPVAANSIVVDLLQTNLATGQPKITSAPIARPSGTAPTITWSKDLPPGKYAITATAYPQADGTGIAQAVGSGTITIASSQNTSATVIMGSTVTELNILPLNPSVAPGATTQLSAAATDAAGDVILIANSAVSWSSSDPTIATIDATGTTPTVHGIKVGTVQISATFTEVEPLLSQNPVAASPIMLLVSSTPPPTTWTLTFSPGFSYTDGTKISGSCSFSSDLLGNLTPISSSIVLTPAQLSPWYYNGTPPQVFYPPTVSIPLDTPGTGPTYNGIASIFFTYGPTFPTYYNFEYTIRQAKFIILDAPSAPGVFQSENFAYPAWSVLFVTDDVSGNLTTFSSGCFITVTKAP